MSIFKNCFISFYFDANAQKCYFSDFFSTIYFAVWDVSEQSIAVFLKHSQNNLVFFWEKEFSSISTLLANKIVCLKSPNKIWKLPEVFRTLLLAGGNCGVKENWKSLAFGKNENVSRFFVIHFSWKWQFHKFPSPTAINDWTTFLDLRVYGLK